MLPAPQPVLQAPFRRLRPRNTALFPLAGRLALCGAGGPALAQESPPTESPAPSGEAATQDMETIAFEADRVEFNDDSQEVTAIGNVLLRRGVQTLRADRIVYDTDSGRIVATGNIRMVDEDGNQLYTDEVELTDEFKAGAMQNMLLALREGGRLVSAEGKQDENGNVALTRAAYSACAVEDEKGCPRKPSWRVTADRVTYDATSKVIHFRGARLELFGLPLVPLPGLRVMADGRATSGLTIPDLRITPSNGVEVRQGYYFRLSENRDLTANAYLYSKVAPMASVQYRALGEKGAWQVTGYATSSRRELIAGGGGASREFRGHLAGNGRFQFDPNWSLTFAGRVVTDRTFLRRYDISRDDRLRSMVDLERIDADSYFSFAGWATQTLRTGAPQGQVPLALPAIDYRRRMADPLLGGGLELRANSLAILRTDGQDTQRLFASARWDLRRLTGMGQEVTLTGLLRGDLYHSDENALTTTAIYRGRSGWQTRGVATAAVDVKWPFAGQVMGGWQVLTPRFQLVASPKIRNLIVPNEDARAIDLEDSNLFALNRFPGHDRIEDGVRFTYGLDWQLEVPRWRFKTTIGQSYRLTSEPTLLPDGTGLTSRTSDIVGRTEVRYRDMVKLTHRFRLDKDSLSVRRNEFDLTVGSDRTYAELGYLRLNRNIARTLEDLQDREELRLAGRVAFARYWSMFGSAVVNLTDRKEDPSFTSDGWEPLRTRLGVAYQDDCLELAFTWRRDFARTGDARKGNSFQVTFGLRNLGFR